MIKTEASRDKRPMGRSGEPELLRRAIELVRSGDTTAARVLLVDICRKNNQSELGWLWLASVARNPKESIACIEQVLRINPANPHALAWKAKLVRETGAAVAQAAGVPSAAEKSQTMETPVQTLASAVDAATRPPDLGRRGHCRLEVARDCIAAESAGEGDLTKEAEVSADMTGAIADSFNFMIGELRTLIGDVQKTTQTVSSSASQIRERPEHLATGSEEQSAQILVA